MTSQRQTTLFEDAQLDADELANQYDDECQWLVALSDWQITVIFSLLRYAEWTSRWVLGSHTWDEIEAKISELEYCLMAGCNVEALLEKFDTLNANLEANNDAIDNLAEQFIYRTGEEEVDIATLTFNMKETLQDIRDNLFVFDGKNVAQIVSELPISPITTAINDLELSSICSPDVNITVQGGSGGCCGTGPGTIIDPPPEDITEETPPPGMQPVVDQTNTQRCHRINYLIDWIGSAIHDFNIFGVGASIDLGLNIILSLIAVIVSNNPLMAFQMYRVLGYLDAIAKLLNSQVDFSSMDTIFNDPDVKKALVCAWYDVDDYDVVGAFSGMGAVLLQEGMNSTEISVVAAIAGTIGVSGIWFEEVMGDPIYEDMDNYTDGIDCGECSSPGTPGVFDFTIDEHGWLIDEANSTNGQYVTGQYFQGFYPDIGDAVLQIYNPELSSVVTVKAWVTGSTGGIGRLSLLTADELEGPWTEVSYFDQFLTPGFTMKEFTNLNIINKYIRLGLLVFWNGPSVYVNRIEFEGVEE